MSATMLVRVLRVDGREEEHTVLKARAVRAINDLIGASSYDCVGLRDTCSFGDVMLVDDDGWECVTVEHGPGHIEFKPVAARKPINERATQLYHAVCLPGTTHQIVGDVAICWDKDWV
jgi:hypothetical protein